jgi:hypothetical protein
VRYFEGWVKRYLQGRVDWPLYIFAATNGTFAETDQDPHLEMHFQIWVRPSPAFKNVFPMCVLPSPAANDTNRLPILIYSKYVYLFIFYLCYMYYYSLILFYLYTFIFILIL